MGKRTETEKARSRVKGWITRLTNTGYEVGEDLRKLAEKGTPRQIARWDINRARNVSKVLYKGIEMTGVEAKQEMRAEGKSFKQIDKYMKTGENFDVVYAQSEESNETNIIENAGNIIPPEYLLEYYNFYENLSRIPSTSISTNLSASGRSVYLNNYSLKVQQDLLSRVNSVVESMGGGDIGRAAVGKCVQIHGDSFGLAEAIRDVLYGSSEDRILSGRETIVSLLSLCEPLEESNNMEGAENSDSFNPEILEG